MGQNQPSPVADDFETFHHTIYFDGVSWVGYRPNEDSGPLSWLWTLLPVGIIAILFFAFIWFS